MIAWQQGEIWKWEAHEVEALKQMYPCSDVSFKDICEKLSRSRGSVSGKARILGLRRPEL